MVILWEIFNYSYRFPIGGKKGIIKIRNHLIFEILVLIEEGKKKRIKYFVFTADRENGKLHTYEKNFIWIIFI